MRIWFVHEGTGGTPFLSTKGREGTRRTATATHLSTEDTEGRGELQRRLQLPFVHGGPRRATKNCNGNTFVHGGHGGPRRTATATATSFCPRRAAKEHEELQRQHICPRRTRRAAENCNGDCNFLLSTTRRAAENCKGHEENHCKVIIWFVHEGPRRTPYVVDADHGRRSRESGEKRSDCARRRPVFVTLEESSRRTVNGTWSVVPLGPGVDQEIDFGNIDVILPRNWERPVERRRI